jgi:hypothetical protein
MLDWVLEVMNKFCLRFNMKLLLLCSWFSLFVAGIIHYSGSSLSYTLFSLVFLAMLISGFYRQISYGYLFLVVMFWLGFWFKLTVHLLVDYPFGEPIGFFVGTPAAWDKVLLIATVGGVGVIIARLLYSLIRSPSTILAPNSVLKAPDWYPAIRRLIWAVLMFSCIALAVFNASLGIMKIGLTPNTILLWPLNALISLLLTYGLAFFVATLLWWDVALSRNISLVVYCVLLEAFFSTVSILSRATYIFHVIPQLLGLYKNRVLVVGWSKKNVISVTAVFILLFAISNPIVNSLRGYYYSNITPVLVSGEGLSGETISFIRFAADRWIGAEGVMAVSAYHKNNNDLIMRALTERGEIGKSAIYQEICQSHYRFVDMKKFQFASLPGAVGFLYFTGHLWAVVLGVIVLVLLILGSEGLVFRSTGNPLLCALWGGSAASAVAQMGVAPGGLLLYFFELSCCIAVICFVQSEFFTKFLQKSSGLINVKSEV